VALAAIATASAGGSQSPPLPPYKQLVRRFDYAAGPLDLRREGSRVIDGLPAEDVSFRSPRGGRIAATLILPTGPGPYPALIVQPGAGGTRDDILADTHPLPLVRAGAAVLSIESPDVRPGAGSFPACTRRDSRSFVQYVVDLRRSIDVLQTRADVDARRIGYVGFDYGASVGATLSGVDHRVKAYALMSGAPSQSLVLANRCRKRLTPRQRALFRRSLRFVDAVNYVGHAAPAALLFQAGILDKRFGQATVRRYFKVASKPKTFLWYEGGERLPKRATLDRVGWLRARLRF
jgi:dienelactone hydrolase